MSQGQGEVPVIKLTEAQEAALFLLDEQSSILTSQIEETQSQNCFGDVVPGRRAFKRLEALGLCVETEEEPVMLTDDPDDEPFTFTNSFDITDEGRALAKKLRSLDKKSF
ncbi:hypothetical protein ACYPKM_02570 [Pseudomonas aeruginosa]